MISAVSSPLSFLSAVSMATYLRRHPTPDDAVHEAAYLPMQAGVKLEPFAQNASASWSPADNFPEQTRHILLAIGTIYTYDALAQEEA